MPKCTDLNIKVICFDRFPSVWSDTRRQEAEILHTKCPTQVG